MIAYGQLFSIVLCRSAVSLLDTLVESFSDRFAFRLLAVGDAARSRCRDGSDDVVEKGMDFAAVFVV
jgi:hypothetical protein